MNINKTISPNKIITLAAKKNVDILMLVEMNPNRPLSYKEKIVIASENSSVVIILLNTNIKIKTKIIHENFIMITLQQSKINLIVYYLRPYNNYKTTEEYQHLIKQITTNKAECLAMGDANAHHTSLGDESDIRGEEIYSIINDNGWSIINDPTISTYTHTSGLMSTNDWSIATSNIASQATWQVDRDFDKYSDHSMCITSLKVDEPQSHTAIILKPRKFIKKILSLTSIDQLHMWHEHITQAATYAESEKQVHQYEDFYNQQLVNSKKKIIAMNKRLKILNLTSTREEVEQLKQRIKTANKAHKAEVKRAKENHYLEFLRQADQQNVFKRVTQPIKTRNRHNISNLQVNNQLVVDPQQVANHIINAYAPANQPEPEDNTHLYSTYENHPALTNIEIKETIISFKPRKAPGVDRISAELIQMWYKENPTYLNELFKMWFEQRIFPHQFKECLIVPIIKDNTKPATVTNIRCLGMLNHIAKMYEKLICKRLSYITTINNFFGPEQQAYLPGRSADRAVRKIQDIRMKNAHALPPRHELVASLDIKAAFDSIKHSAVLDALLQAQCPANIFEIMKDYFTHRIAKVKIANASYEKLMTKGIVQGSSLSAFLWALSIETIIKQIKSEAAKLTTIKFNLIVYADDISWVISSTSGFTECMKAMTILFNKTNEALEKIGLHLSAAKTQIMLTHTGPVNLKLQLNQEQIPMKSEVKILGVIFSKENSFKAHINNVIKKAKFKYSQMAQAMRSKNALSKRLKERLIEAIIYPTVAYACDTWYDPGNQQITTPLKVLSRSMQIRSFHAFKTTSHIAAMFLSEILPLQYWVKMRAAIIAALRKNKWHSNYIDKKALPEDKTPLHLKESVDFGKILNNYQVEDLHHSFKIFTDGSRRQKADGNHLVGCAMVINEKSTTQWQEHLYKMTSFSTISQAEALALRKALEWIEQHNPPSAAILSDSQSMLMAMCSHNPSFKSTCQMQAKLKQVRDNNPNVDLYWVKAHAGIGGNERADQAANRAATEGELHQSYVTISHIKSSIKKRIINEINEEIRTSPWGRTIKIFFNSIDDKMRRSAIINETTAKIYTGHLPLRQYLHERKKISSPTCSCGKIHDVKHIITDCKEHVEKNILAARATQLSLDELFGDWDVLRCNKKLHRYIANRARTLIPELIEASKNYQEQNHQPQNNPETNQNESTEVQIDYDEQYEQMMEAYQSATLSSSSCTVSQRTRSIECNPSPAKRPRIQEGADDDEQIEPTAGPSTENQQARKRPVGNSTNESSSVSKRMRSSN